MKKPGFIITELWAYVSIDTDGEEGIMAELINGMWIPLIGADDTRRDLLQPMAEAIGNKSGRPYKLKRFVLVEDK